MVTNMPNRPPVNTDSSTYAVNLKSVVPTGVSSGNEKKYLVALVAAINTAGTVETKIR